MPLQVGSSEPDLALKMLIPIGRSMYAIAAGYLGLCSVLFFPAPFAILMGILGLREIKKNPGLGGKGRAIFGIVMGTLAISIPLIIFIAAAIADSSR